MGIEAWPLSRRSRHTAHLTWAKDNLAVGHWFEEGNSIPIIPVERTEAWRPGGQQFAYIGFTGLRGDNFALSFDEPRLFEALAMFLRATGAYENSSSMPLVSAERVQIRAVDGRTSVLHVKIRGGATIAIHLPDEMLASLKKQINQSEESE